MVNSPVFTSWDQVFRFATVTVEGSITGRVDSVSILDDPAVEDLTWSLWELQINDPLGATVPETLIVVGVDHESTDVPSESLPIVREGLTGLFALDTADAEGRTVLPDHGRTYYPVAILEETPSGYVHTVGTLPPLESVDELREAITADNNRGS